MSNQMEGNKQNTEQFEAVIRYHSQISGFDCEQPLSLFQMTASPYDYYLELVICDTVQRADFYKTIAKMGTLVVCPDYIKTENSLSLLFYNIFSLGEKDKLKMHMFFKYYNFSLSQWANTLKDTNGVVAQNDLLYIFKSLLSLAIVYSNSFNEHAKVFQSNKIFISIDRRLKIYPFAFQFHGQQIINSYLNRSQCYNQKLKKNISLSTSTLSMRRIDSESQCPRVSSTQIDPSLRDILLIILEMLTFKGKDYFFSRKHNSVIWDSVRNVLNIPNIVGYLSQSFLLILKDIVNGKLRDMNKVMERVEAVIEERDISCINLSMKSNMEALGVKQMVVSKDRSEQIKKLKSKLSVSPFLKKLRQY